MHPWQHIFVCPGNTQPTLRRGFVLVTPLAQAGVPCPPVGVNHAARLNGLSDECLDAGRRSISNASHADPADLAAILLCRNENQRLLAMFAALRALLRGAPLHLIHLHASRQPIPARPNHRPTQLVQPRPSRLITAQPQDSLQVQCTGAILLRRHPPDSSEPHRQGLMRILEDRACRHGGLIAALAALPPLAQSPSLAMAASRTTKAIRPSKARQIRAASIFGREAILQLSQSSWIIFHEPDYYRLGLPESIEYPRPRNAMFVLPWLR